MSTQRRWRDNAFAHFGSPVPSDGAYAQEPHIPSTAPAPNAWRKQAACHGIPTEMFFRVGVPPRLVVETCARCPVRGQCVTDAIDTEFDWTNHGHHVARGYRGVSATTRMRIHRDAP